MNDHSQDDAGTGADAQAPEDAPIHGTEPETDDEPVQKVEPGAEPLFRLPDRYKGALAGISISMRRRPRFIYSLEELCAIVQRENPGCGLNVARETVVKLIYAVESQHGANAPLFADMKPQPERSRIIKPWQR